MSCFLRNKLSNIFHTWSRKCNFCTRCCCGPTWAMSVDVLWEGLARQWFALGGHGGYGNFCALAWAEACSGSHPPLWSPAWLLWISLDILNILGKGRGLLQLIHTQKCWDERREQILSPLQARSAAAFDPTHKKGVGQGRDPQAAPSLGGSAVDSALAPASWAGFCHLPGPRNHSYPAPLLMQTRF